MNGLEILPILRNSGQSKVTGAEDVHCFNCCITGPVPSRRMPRTSCSAMAAASPYAIVMLITMIAWMAYTYYLSYVGKNRVATSGRRDREQ